MHGRAIILPPGAVAQQCGPPSRLPPTMLRADSAGKRAKGNREATTRKPEVGGNGRRQSDVTFLIFVAKPLFHRWRLTAEELRARVSVETTSHILQ